MIYFLTKMFVAAMCAIGMMVVAAYIAKWFYDLPTDDGEQKKEE